MLKVKTILGLFGLALCISFMILCFMTFVVLPRDVLLKSSFQRARGLPTGKRVGGSSRISRQKINSFLKSNETAGRFAIRHIVEIDGNSKKISVLKSLAPMHEQIDGNQVTTNQKPVGGLLMDDGRLKKDHELEKMFDKNNASRQQTGFQLLRVRPGVHETSDDEIVNEDLLVKTLRDHGMHPQRARALISAIIDKDKKH